MLSQKGAGNGCLSLSCASDPGVVTKVHRHDSFAAELGKQPSGSSRLTGLTKETTFQALSLGARSQGSLQANGSLVPIHTC